MRHASNPVNEKSEITPVRRAHHRKVAALFVAACAFYLVLLGCTPHKYAGSVDSMTVSNTGPKLDEKIVFTVKGTGNCSLRVDFGDNTFFDPGGFYDFSKWPDGLPVEHTYTGWPGTKSVVAYGIADGPGDCSGSARSSILVGPRYALAFVAPLLPVCGLVPDQPQLIAGWNVHITTNPDPRVKIDFGCILSGCTYDADGEPNSVAPAEFPFPGLHKYSLVIKIGTQVVQGGTDVSFVVDQIGAMELCVNDDVLSGNSGAWGIFIEVNT
ncbi:MAG TPA: hypothetical protein VGJ22_08685 [Anaerolineales bacterium]|jgi:hypothetical protein